MACKNYCKTTEYIDLRLKLSRPELIKTENRKVNVLVWNEQKETIIQLSKKVNYDYSISIYSVKPQGKVHGSVYNQVILFESHAFSMNSRIVHKIAIIGGKTVIVYTTVCMTHKSLASCALAETCNAKVNKCALFLNWALVSRAVSILASGSFEFPRAHLRIFDIGRVEHLFNEYESDIYWWRLSARKRLEFLEIFCHCLLPSLK